MPEIGNCGVGKPEDKKRCKRMKRGEVEVICGTGIARTALAIGRGVAALTRQKNVIMIQFLRGSHQEGLDVLKCMEPRFKVFRFEKADTYFENLSEEEKQEGHSCVFFKVRVLFSCGRRVSAVRRAASQASSSRLAAMTAMPLTTP